VQPALGGTLHAFPFAQQFFLGTDPAGSSVVSTTWPTGFPMGTTFWIQYLMEDLTVAPGILLSNGVQGTTP
jgi:hypothetical protein